MKIVMFYLVNMYIRTYVGRQVKAFLFIFLVFFPFPFVLGTVIRITVIRIEETPHQELAV